MKVKCALLAAFLLTLLTLSAALAEFSAGGPHPVHKA